MTKYLRGSFDLNNFTKKDADDLNIEDLKKILNEQNKKMKELNIKNQYINKILLKKNKIIDTNNMLKNINDYTDEMVKNEMKDRFTYCNSCKKYITNKCFNTHTKSKTCKLNMVKVEISNSSKSSNSSNISENDVIDNENEYKNIISNILEKENNNDIEESKDGL